MTARTANIGSGVWFDSVLGVTLRAMLTGNLSASTGRQNLHSKASSMTEQHHSDDSQAGLNHSSDHDGLHVTGFEHLQPRLRQCCEGTLPGLTDEQRQSYQRSCAKLRHSTTQRETVSTRSPKKPTLLQSALTLTSVMAQTAKRGSLLDEATIAQRLAICQSCEHYTGTSCKLCGCGCGGAKKLMNKLAHAASSCSDIANPKWGPVQ